MAQHEFGEMMKRLAALSPLRLRPVAAAVVLC